MEVLRGRKTGEKVEIGYLRNRGAGTAMISVPEPMRFPLPPPARRHRRRRHRLP